MRKRHYCQKDNILKADARHHVGPEPMEFSQTINLCGGAGLIPINAEAVLFPVTVSHSVFLSVQSVFSSMTQRTGKNA